MSSYSSSSSYAGQRRVPAGILARVLWNDKRLNQSCVSKNNVCTAAAVISRNGVRWLSRTTPGCI